MRPIDEPSLAHRGDVCICMALCPIHGDPRDTNFHIVRVGLTALQERLEQAEERNGQWLICGFICGCAVAVALLALIEALG